MKKFETRSFPNLLVATPRDLTLITRTARAYTSYLAAFPSTRAIPDRDVFYVADPISSILYRLQAGNTANIFQK